MLRHDPLRRVPGRVRLVVGAVLCLAPMGMVWKIGDGYLAPSPFYGGDCGWEDGAYDCAPGPWTSLTYHMGTPELVAQSPVRVFLVFSMIALAVAALRGRTATTERLAKLACASLGFAVLLAASNGVNRTLVCLVIALLFVVPVALAGPVAVRGRREMATVRS